MGKRWYPFGLFVAVLLLSGCMREEAAEEDTGELWEPVGQAVSTAIVTRQDVFTAEYYGAWIVPEAKELCFSIAGTVATCDVVIGDSVSKYQILATLDEGELVAQLEEIERRMERQEEQFAYENALWELETQKLRTEYEGLLAQSAGGTDGSAIAMQAELLQLSLERREAEYEEVLARQEQTMSRLQGEYDRVNAGVTENIMTAPFDGVVLRCGMREGTKVSANEYVLAVADLSAFYIECNDIYLSESMYKKFYACRAYRDGELLEIEYQPYSEEELEAARGAQLPTCFLYTGEVPLTFGDYITVELISEMAQNVLAVPSEAIFNDGTSRYVYKMVNGVKQRTEVFVGLDNGMLSEIESGELKEGDEIYVPN